MGSGVPHGFFSSPQDPGAWAGATGALQAGMLPAKRVGIPGSTRIRAPRGPTAAVPPAPH